MLIYLRLKMNLLNFLVIQYKWVTSEELLEEALTTILWLNQLVLTQKTEMQFT